MHLPAKVADPNFMSGRCKNFDEFELRADHC